MEHWKTLVEIRDSPFGKGLFAKHDLQQGTVITTLKGRKVNFQATLALSEESHALQTGFDRYLICGAPFIYANHSCNPNTAINDELRMFCLKNIAAGQELLWDYSTSMLERHWNMSCSCKEERCRKIVTDFDLLPRQIQDEYLKAKIVMPFIAEFLRSRKKAAHVHARL